MWVKLDTSYLRHPKLQAVSVHARLLHLSSILWTAEHQTDGFVARMHVAAITSAFTLRHDRAQRWVDELVAVALWDERPDGWHVHDFEIHNRTSLRANVEAARAAQAERVRRWRLRNGVTE